MAPGVMLNVAMIAALGVWIAARASSPTKAVRLRNALLADVGESCDFEWTPDRPPHGFRTEQRTADAHFVGVTRSLDLGCGEEWARALRIATHLVENAKDTGPVRSNLRTTYDAIRAGHGYCADFVRVFIALAHAADVPVRQWGFSFDGFGGHGHTLVEIYDRVRHKWLMIDVYNNFHVVDATTGEPLSVLEYRDSLLGRRGGANIVANGPGRPGFVHEATAQEYYRRGINQWYLLWGNAVYSHYGHPVVGALGKLSQTAAQVAANALRVQPRLRIYATSENAEEVRRLLALRRELLIAAGIGTVLIIALAVQIFSAVGSPRAA